MRAGRGGVQMSFVGPGSELRRETGADGRFEFRGLKAGDYTVSARRPGFSRATVDPVNVTEARAAEPLELVLKPGATISGVVRDKAGAGASGWYVSARAASQAGGPVFGPGSIRSEEPTGPDGVFYLEGLTTGETYELQVMGQAGLGPRKAGVVAPAEGVDLVVTGTGQIRGRVVDGDSGRAIPDFQVRYQPDAQGGMRFVMRMGPGRGRGPYEKQPFHAEDGSFVLEDVAAGRWTVEAFAPGYQAGSASAVVVGEGEATEGVEVRLSKGGVITGQVLESRGGRPILDATVRAELSGGGPRMAMIRMGGEGGDNEAATDADGRYEIAGLAPGTWTVTASHPDWSEATTSVELKDAPATADIRLGRGGSVGGTVLAGGRPVAGAQVSLSASGSAGAGMMGGGEQSALSDDGGRFRFERLNPGRYSLGASLRDQSSAPGRGRGDGRRRPGSAAGSRRGRPRPRRRHGTAREPPLGRLRQRPGPGLLGHRAHRRRRHVRAHRRARGRRHAAGQCRRLHDRLPVGLRHRHHRARARPRRRPRSSSSRASAWRGR